MNQAVAEMGVGCMVRVEELRKTLDSFRPFICVRKQGGFHKFVRWDFSPDSISVSASSCETKLRRTLCDSGPQKSGVVTVCFRQLQRIVDEIQSERVEVSFDSTPFMDRLILRFDEGRIAIEGGDPEKFPVVATQEAQRKFNLDQAELGLALSRVIFARDPEISRYSLGSVCLHTDAKSVKRLVATDGRRLALSKLTCTANEPEGKILIPGEAADWMNTIIPNLPYDQVVRVESGEHHVRFRLDGAEVVSRQTEGRFPRWQDVLRATCKSRVTANADQWMKVFAVSAACVSDEYKPAQLRFEDRQIFVTVDNVVSGVSHTTQAAAMIDGKPPQPLIDPRLLVPFFATMEPGVQVKLDMNDPEDSLEFSTPYGDVLAVMPIHQE